MRLLRVSSIFSLLIATVLFGTMGSAHGLIAGDAHEQMMSVPVDPHHEHKQCCDEGADRTASCHLLPALIPTSATAHTTSGPRRLFVTTRATLPAGIEPTGLLDPPRLI